MWLSQKGTWKRDIDVISIYPWQFLKVQYGKYPVLLEIAIEQIGCFG